MVEKPFGTDLASARDLNALLHRHVDESAVFRIDHVLGKQTVQNVLGLRFANRLFEPLWCADHVDRVDIVWDETVALEGRAGYYDHTGALRDMVQNHLLQLLCFVAMDRPGGLGERPLRDAKVAVLRAVRDLDDAEVRRHTVRGRYTAGTVDGRRIPDYTAEPGVDAVGRPRRSPRSPRSSTTTGGTACRSASARARRSTATAARSRSGSARSTASPSASPTTPARTS